MRVFGIISALLILFSAAASVAQSGRDKLVFPVPRHNPDMLFYLQRSLDINTVIYEAKYNAPVNFGDLDPNEPVNIYWIRYTDGGSVAPLSSVQKLGYGIKSEKLDDQVVKITLVAYRKMSILLKPAPKINRYRAHITIKGKEIILSRVYIHIAGGTKLKPKVTYIEVTGTHADSDEKVVERLYP
jgi:hypothetical protein